MNEAAGGAWPLCFAGEDEGGAPMTEVWCSHRPDRVNGEQSVSITIRGPLCEPVAARIGPALASLEHPAAIVALDLGEVTAIDPAGLALVHTIITVIARSGGRCTITRTSPAYDRMAHVNHAPRPLWTGSEASSRVLENHALPKSPPHRGYYAGA